MSAGELLLIAVLCLVLWDPRDAGRLWGRLRRFRRQWMEWKEALLHEARSVLETGIPSEVPAKEWWEETDPVRLRRWSKERIAALDSEKIAATSGLLLERLEGWAPWREAADVALFASLAGEVPTDLLLAALWKRGTQVWLPWIDPEGIMEMAAVDGPDGLARGRFGIREPRPELRILRAIPPSALVLTPGLVFDHHGGRIGKGKGFYDRWFAAHPQVLPVGLCFDVQVHPGRLERKPHDWPMSHLVTEYRLESFISENC
jgi:5-formyltetrahydrofolate cyclo-ligase